MKKQTRKKPTRTPKKGLSLSITLEAYRQLQKEAAEFGISLSYYVAVLLSHRQDTVGKIRDGNIIIVP